MTQPNLYGDAYEAAQPAPARRTRPARPRPDGRIERDPDGLPVALVLHAPAPVTPYAVHQAEVAQETARLEGSKARILARLRQGPATGPELNTICFRYTGRMSDLRLHDGYIIDREHVGGGVWRYSLRGVDTTNTV